MELKITKETARKIYPDAPNYIQEILLETFGVDCFKKSDFKYFKTFDDLCHAVGTTETDFNKKWDPAIFDDSTIAFERLKVCTKAYNQDWPFDIYNTEQYKYYPYFAVSSSGFGFSSANYYYDGTDSIVGSRLCTDTSEKAIWILEQFPELWKHWLLNVKPE